MPGFTLINMAWLLKVDMWKYSGKELDADEVPNVVQSVLELMQVIELPAPVGLSIGDGRYMYLTYSEEKDCTDVAKLFKDSFSLSQAALDYAKAHPRQMSLDEAQGALDGSIS